jgi:hypothetical protein
MLLEASSFAELQQVIRLLEIRTCAAGFAVLATSPMLQVSNNIGGNLILPTHPTRSACLSDVRLRQACV